MTLVLGNDRGRLGIALLVIPLFLGAAAPPPVSFISTSPLTDTIRNDIVMRTKTGGG